jgi:hypothetical protein
MKKIILAVAIATLSLSAVAKGGGHGGRGGGHYGGHPSHSYSSHPATGTGSKASREHVSGYTKRNGTHVTAHNRSTGDSTKANNWSTKGNVNPETGKAGTK